MCMGTNSNREPVFRFREFSVVNNMAGMKVGTDGVLLGAWADGDGCAKALDVGTGCGLIALMLAQRYKALKVLGIDIMDNAVCEAAEKFLSYRRGMTGYRPGVLILIVWIIALENSTWL